MTKADKIIIEDESKRNTVLAILKLLNGESYNDAKEILALAQHFFNENCCFDFNFAEDMINAKIIEVD